MKKILLLSDLNSVHTQRWASSLAEAGFKIDVVGLIPLIHESPYYNHSEISIHSLTHGRHSKLKFLFGIFRFLKIVGILKPDLVHAHFATSYGLLASLVKRYPLFITLWGDDILIFPFKSFLHRKIIQFNLNRADRIYSASGVMKVVAEKFTSKSVTVIPFGVDVDKFKPIEGKKLDEIIIGTVKSLEDIYGIDSLIIAFSELKKLIHVPIKLQIVGEGSKEKELKQLVKNLNLTEYVEFKGRVDHSKIPEIINKLDIFVALSRSESFGVAVVEAQACGKPVVVSDVGGLPEVISDHETGFIIPVGNTKKTVEALERLILNQSLRQTMGVKGRQRVLDNFDWHKNVEKMICEYNSLTETNGY